MSRLRPLPLILTSAAMLLAGCATQPPATQPAALAPTYHHLPTGLQFRPPAGWMVHPTTEYVLRVSPPGTTPDVAAISVDVPELPPHIPGLIPIGLVKNGYVDDMKKAHPGVAVGDADERMIAGAKARLVRSDWTENGRSRHETAMLIVKGDHVIILRATCDQNEKPTTLAAFDEVVKSVEWK